MTLLAAYFHDLSPFAVRFTEAFGVRWYGLSYVLGFLIAWYVLTRLAKRRAILLSPEHVSDLMLAVIVGTIVGGRLGYVLFYRPDLLLEFTSRFPFWGLLDIMHGGMASHGGIVCIILACWWTARRVRTEGGATAPPLHVMDCISLVAPFGIFLGRLANFINGELLGRIVVHPADAAGGAAQLPWWGVRYPQELLERSSEARLDETQQIELESLLLPYSQPIENDLTFAAGRAIEEIQRGDHELARALEPLISVRHPSQLYQAFAEGVCLIVLLWALWRIPKKPGVITAWFLIAYGVGRVITEFWRLPDAHLAVQRVVGLSRGQWLSVLMVVAGAALLWWVSKRTAAAVGGWGVKRGATA
ncbi:MAG: prolipoprotein diacylglyceryl transferase [Phycisphaerales bacterium]